MKLFLKWLNGNPKIAGLVTEPKTAFKVGKREFFFRSPFKTYWPYGPSIEAYKYHNFLHHKLSYFDCKSCGVGVWGWGQRDYCGSYKCFRKLFSDR